MNKDKAIYSLTEGKKLNLKREADLLLINELFLMKDVKIVFNGGSLPE